MNPVNWTLALQCADSLDPHKDEPANRLPVCKEEADSYFDMMTPHQVSSLLATYQDPTYSDLCALRNMLACELATRCREEIIYRITNKHELLYKAMRMEPMLNDLPMYRVWLEAKAPRTVPNGGEGKKKGKEQKASPGATLHSALNSALFSHAQN